ncbi:AAA family ATPase [Effusibacillus lacus]|uniref:Stage V sporulation protein K n=1 Tax=Effusibacillus lacus TaxID=1348429 RepID=A0A292YS72_9BACL|nr:AAA family ATPase [Effusibacillus lacus]TCS75827.1 stage V sporulation protein K [Effusibacillus lacus]GAX91779.1 stage V sporulation protein K [Effusibacillus lacus]
MNKGGRRSPVYRDLDEILEQFRSGQLALNDALRRLHTQEKPTLSKERKNMNSLQDTARFQQTLQELDTMIGLKQVKGLVREIYALIQIQQRRQAAKLAAEPVVLHMIFKGNPGTGKTTVARILARLLRELGFLSKGHLIEVERADLVGEYIGHTAQKTREQVKRALGGILFIDEAYSLARGGEKDFGKEAIDTLVKAMEDHKNDFVLILAGYELEIDLFLRTNPGLPSRFPITVSFDDYEEHELVQIGKQMLREREYRLSPEAEQKLRLHLKNKLAMDRRNFANARLVRNIIERAIRMQALRLLDVKNPTREELMVILPDDFSFEEGNIG